MRENELGANKAHGASESLCAQFKYPNECYTLDEQVCSEIYFLGWIQSWWWMPCSSFQNV
jgi:hypothetical protein